MDTIAGFFIHQPLHILGVSLVLFLVWIALRPRVRSLLIAALAWFAYAGWEWLMLVRSPQADIRFDLLLLWPILVILTLWGCFKLVLPRLRPKKQHE